MLDPSTRFDAITLGESMALLAAAQPGPLAGVQRFSRHLAGAETNVAIGLARLGLRTAWISRLGCDAFGDFVLDSVQREGVDCSRVVRDPRRCTGVMFKTLAAPGADPQVHYLRRGSAASALSVLDLDEGFFAAAGHLHVTGITPALSDSADWLVVRAMDFMRRQGRTVSFDPNLRPSLWDTREQMVAHINQLAPLADWVLPGLEEGRLLTGKREPHDVAAFYLERGARAVVVKLGAEGAYFATPGERGYVPGVPVAPIVDTVGAGDGFAAGVISARLEGLTWAEAVARGNWIGARALRTRGDMEALPHRHELPDLLPASHHA